MEKNGYIAGHPIPTIEALQSWLDRGQPVFYGDGLVGATALRMSALAYLEAAIKRGDLRYGLPGPEPEAPAEKPARFRRKPTVVEALRWTGKNGAELVDFLGGPNSLLAGMPPVVNSTFSLTIRLEEKVLAVEPGDYVVKDEHGEVVPLSAKFFAEGYEPVEDAAVSQEIQGAEHGR
jgi:hypothetical protein